MASLTMASRKHHYATCRDDGCPSILCQAYKDGFEDGAQWAIAAAGSQ